MYVLVGTAVVMVSVLLVRLPSQLPNWAEERLRAHTQIIALDVAFILAYPVSWVKGVDYMRALRYISSLAIANNDFNSPSMKVSRTQLDGVPVEIFRPQPAPDSAPAIVYLHGGGWSMMEADGYENTAHQMAKDFNVVIISVDYRQAPEHPYPVPFEDCLRAVVHVLNNAHTLGLDPNRIAIAGSSAGGNLAAAVALRLSQDDMADTLPSLQFQVLIYPALQMLDLNTGSYTNFSTLGLLSRRFMAQLWLRYLGFPELYPHVAEFEANQHSLSLLKDPLIASYLNPDHLPEELRLPGFEPARPESGNETLAAKVRSRLLDPYFCPLVAGDVSGVPPAYFVLANMDILRDEGLLYLHRLQQAGVSTQLDLYHGMGHGFFFVTPTNHMLFERTRQAFGKLRDFVKTNL
ncbi:hypothetical protein ACOMHN_013073 [Nucella lapillus]